MNQPPDANFILQLLLAAVFIGQAITLWVGIANRKQKREVSFGFEPASKTEFEKHVETNRREHENLFSKIGGVERGAISRVESVCAEWRAFTDQKFSELNAESNRGREKLHDRINEVLEAVAELRGKVEERHR